MEAFHERCFRALEKLAKKHDPQAKVPCTTAVRPEGKLVDARPFARTKAHSLPITRPRMRKTRILRGHPAFKAGGQGRRAARPVSPKEEASDAGIVWLICRHTV